MERLVTLKCDLLKEIDYSFSRNNVPAAKNLVITNTCGEELKDITVRIGFEPEFGSAEEIKLPLLRPDVPVEISEVGIKISSEFMLSLKENTFGYINFSVRSGEKLVFTETRQVTLLMYENNEMNVPKAVTKQDIWERKLLDLSLRNSLLNFRPRGSSVQLFVSDLGEFENLLSEDKSFRIASAPKEISFKENDVKLFEPENPDDIKADDLKLGKVYSDLSEGELEKTLKKIHRQAKVSLEENGANTLYLALGFLRWYENEKKEKPRIAPIILIPVDIVRKIHDRSYTIRIRGEEPQLNVTLLELLRQDFGIVINGLSPLPMDENGLDIPLIFNTVKGCINSADGWEIIKAAFLGHFSFSRFIMWNDIKSRCDDLRKNKIVSSLIDGKITWDVSGKPVENPDSDIHPSNLAVPTSADSSQLSAIYDASSGESFVLHGPPGTGKSQTITNMIANALYQGKSVLFVAEKMAALSVVQKRLAKLGLDPFCLELHSNKAQKRAVLSQLEKTLNINKTGSPESYSKTAENIYETRERLNKTIAALHKKQNYGLSLYDTLMLFEENAAFKGKTDVGEELIKTLNETGYESLCTAVTELSSADMNAGGIYNSPLKAIGLRAYTPEMRDRFKETAQRLISVSEKAASTYESAFGIKAAGIVTAQSAAEAVKLMLDSEHIFGAVIKDSEFDLKSERINKLISDGLDYSQISYLVNEEFDKSVKDYNAGEAYLEWKKAEQKWIIGKYFGKKKLLKEMGLFRKKGIPSEEEFTAACEKLTRHKELCDSITSADSGITSLFGALWAGTETDFNRLNKCYTETLGLRKAVSEIRGEEIVNVILSVTPEKKGIFREYAESFDSYKAVETELKESYKVDFSLVYCEYPSCFLGAGETARKWLAGIGALREYCAVLSAGDKVEELGLSELKKDLFSGKLSHSELLPSFLSAFAYTSSNMVISSEPLLSEFRGKSFEDIIGRFKKLDDEFMALTGKELVAKLSAEIPEINGSAAESSEIGMLLKAIKSGGRMTPIRKLFDNIPNLLRRLCPCMLMSPISVAQYIDPSFPKFDLVIFDEASQLPTCEAVGAIARGENAVIVGDPNQLPPTSFFNAEHTDEDNYEIDDLESVLDDCLALAMPQRKLRWHYRSRHESLIAYSNAKYYENSLLTFPSPDDIVSRVKWIKVDGYYDRSGTKQNFAEAKAIVDEIVKRISDEELRKESIGVVTFSLVQQILIDDMLSERFRENPELEQLANSMYEPILVKNLENVQGDERDVILFSIGYGPDKEGHVTMNFGPINRDGGWRRLNVAITRARKGMYVYSVITPDQIDLNKTASEGVAGLKGFLEFARLGNSALPVRKAVAAEKDTFAEFIAAEIRKLGYEARCNIGCSEYKIDVGVVNPNSPDKYILGIRCDGRRYLESGSARDRCVLQPSVLSGLGWNIMNVWILDVYDNLPKVLDEIKMAIETALKAYREGVPVSVASEPSAQKPAEAEEPVPAAKVKTEQLLKYKSFIPEIVGSPDDFYESKSTSEIRRICEEIIVTEAPVSVDALIKKVISSFEITRVTAKAEERVRDILSVLPVTEKSGYVWKNGEEDYELFRIPDEDGEKRSMDEIPPEEIANAVRYILKNQLGMTRADLIRETAHIFGYSRMGGVIEKAAEEGIAIAVSRGFAKEEGDRISFSNNN